MAKRFIETGVFRKPFIRGLQGAYKTLFFYYITECDHAGIWDLSNLDIDSILIGQDFKKEDIKEAFDGKIILIENKLFMPDFINYQYGSLNPENRVHKSVILRLESLNIDVKKLKLKMKNKPLRSPLQGVKDKDKDKDIDKDKDKTREKSLPHGEKFAEAWENWLEHLDQKKKKPTELAKQRQLKKLENMPESDSIHWIDYAIEKNWQGLYDPFSSENGQSNSKRSQSLQNTSQYQ